jgi:hypothetical protein
VLLPTRKHWVALLLLSGTLLLGFLAADYLQKISPGLPSVFVWQVRALPLISCGVFALGAKVGLPRLLYGAPFLALAFVFCGFTQYRHRDANILVQPLQGDSLWASTRRFSSRLEVLRDESFSVSHLPWTVSNGEEATKIFETDVDVRAIIGGDSSYLTLYVPERTPLSLSEVSHDLSDSWIGQLRLVRDIRSLRVPLDTAGTSISFLTDLFRGLASHEGELTATKVTDLQSAASRVAFWRTYSHRAYPYFLLGNYYTKQMVKLGAVGGADALCAKDAFGSALGVIFFRDNPELYAALTNNLAVMIAYQGGVKKNRKMVKRAKDMIRALLPRKRRRDHTPLLSKQSKKIFRNNLRVLKDVRFGKNSLKGKNYGTSKRASSRST